MGLENKVAVVTGSAANIGRATAELFAAEGAKVVVHTQNAFDAGVAVANRINSSGGSAIFVQGDLSDPADVDRLFDTTFAEFGTVDILVNNAGRAIGRPFLETDKQYWIDTFNDNLFSMVLCSQRAAKAMLERGGGVILNTASFRGLEHTGRTQLMAYAASKAAVISFTKTLAKELAPAIRVNAVGPGFVLTPNYEKFPDDLKERFIAGSLVKRWLQPSEVAEAFLYLATAEAVTGEHLIVDGGVSLKLD